MKSGLPVRCTGNQHSEHERGACGADVQELPEQRALSPGGYGIHHAPFRSEIMKANEWRDLATDSLKEPA